MYSITNRWRPIILSYGFIFLALILLCTHSHANTKPLIKQIVVFGDSLSDPGNLYNFTAETRFFTTVPNNPYFHGHFSNGMIWAEDLAQQLGWSTTNDLIESEFNSPLLIYAYGGAWAASGISHKPIKNLIIPDLNKQVAMYIHHLETTLTTAQSPKNHTLFIIFIGGNDFLNDKVFSNAWMNYYYQTTLLNYAVDGVADAVAKLKSQAGAKYIVLIGLPDVSLTPYMQTQSKKLIKTVHENVIQFNNKIKKLAANTQALYVDLFAIFNTLYQKYHCNHCQYTVSPCIANTPHMTAAIRSNPEIQIALNTMQSAASLLATSTNTSEPQDQAEMNFNHCMTGNSAVKYHLFWDAVHPTAEVNDDVANLLLTKQYLLAKFDFNRPVK